MAKKSRKQHPLRRAWRRFEFKHTLIAVVLVSVFVVVVDSAIVQGILSQITSLGYLGMFLSGILFVSFFTAAPAVVLLVTFSKDYDPLTVAAVAGAGAMVGDWLILRFAEDTIARELRPVARKLKLISFINLLHRRRFKPLTATIGAMVVASPLPDEAGITLLGLSHINTIQLLGLTYILNLLGILVLLLAFT